MYNIYNIMNSIEGSNNSNLEHKEISKMDFGDSELNMFYEKLPENIKIQINKKPLLQTKINLLKNMINPELNEIYDNLNEKSKENVDAINVYDKYLLLKKRLDDKKMKSKTELLNKKSGLFEPRTPELPPSSNEVPNEVGRNEVGRNEVPEELLNNANINQDEEEEEGESGREQRDKEKRFQNKKNESSQILFENLVKTYYNYNPYITTSTIKELEVRFGTKGIKRINKNDYDNVIKKLKSLGFTSLYENGEYSLRIQNEYLDNRTGLFKMSEIRTEIYGLNQIQAYCKTNDINEVRKMAINSVKFTNKKAIYVDNQKIFPVNFDDFNFRVSLQDEESPKTGLQNFMISNWKKSKKTFRYLNRVTFVHPDFPINVDISIVKYGNKGTDRFGNQGRGEMIRVYNVDESNVFNNQETYEIELEVNNSMVGPGTNFKTPQIILESLR